MPEESEENERLAKKSEDEKRLAAIEGIFNAAGKIYACPMCHHSYTSFHSLEYHLSRENVKEDKNGPHGKLMEKDLSAFQFNYESVVEWQAAYWALKPIDALHLRSNLLSDTESPRRPTPSI